MAAEIPKCEHCGDDMQYSVRNWGWYVEIDDERFPKDKSKYCMKCYLRKYAWLKAQFHGRSWPPNPDLVKHRTKD